MAAKKTRSDKPSSGAPLGSRKVEEVDFREYLRHKKERRYIEEITLEEYLRKKRPADDAPDTR